jgi:hypothetical protein
MLIFSKAKPNGKPQQSNQPRDARTREAPLTRAGQTNRVRGREGIVGETHARATLSRDETSGSGPGAESREESEIAVIPERWIPFICDLLVLGGLAAISYGAWLAYHPAGFHGRRDWPPRVRRRSAARKGARGDSGLDIPTFAQSGA